MTYELQAMTQEEADELAEATDAMSLHTSSGAIVNSLVFPAWDGDAYEPPHTVCSGDSWRDHRREAIDWYPVLMEGMDE